MNKSLLSYVQNITDLPTIPIVAQEILGIVNDDLISLDKLNKIIEKDPAISAKVLSVANSALFGVNDPAATTSNALLRIGFDNIKNIALSISLMTVFDTKDPSKAVDYNRVFNHSISVGFIARLLSNKLRLNISEEVSLGGMLHDLGILVLNRYFDESYADVVNVLTAEKKLLDTEKEILEFTHADIGSWLAKKWHFHESVIDMISFHHNPSGSEKYAQHTAVIHLADYICTMHIISALEKEYIIPFDPASLEILEISDADIQDIISEIKCGSFFTGLFTP